MDAKTFIDPSVLIYAYDVDAGGKRDIASGIVWQRWDERSGAGSPPRVVVGSYLAWRVDSTPAEIAPAFQIEDEAGRGFRDALILAAARKAGAARLLTEDLNAGQVTAGVRIENPFSRPV